MNDTGTIIGSNVVAEDHAESLAVHLNKLIATILRSEYLLRMSSSSIFCNESWSKSIYLLAWLHPRKELLVVQTFEVGTLHVVDDAPWALLLLLVEWQEITLLALLVSLQIRTYQSLSHHESHRLAIVEVVGLNSYIVNLRTHTESHI